MGIVTGSVASLVVVDVDPLHGGDDSLKAVEQAHGPLPATIKVTTGGGGLHVYLAHPGGLVHNQVGVVPGIDLRGDGGFVVAPLSVHPSGRRYAWLEPDLVGIDPTVVLDLLLGWNARRCRPPLPDDEVARTVESISGSTSQTMHASENLDAAGVPEHLLPTGLSGAAPRGSVPAGSPASPARARRSYA